MCTVRTRVHYILIATAATILALLVGCDESPVQAPQPDWPRITDLFSAHFGDFESFKKLVEQNPALASSAVGGYGTTPLHLAAESNRPQVIEFLVAHGASVNVRNDGGYTPLHAAAYVGALDAVKTLVRLGANVRARAGDWEADEGRGGVTVLAHAAAGGAAEVVQCLLKQGAPILYGKDKWSKPYFKYSALHWAVLGSTNWSHPAEAAGRLRTIDLLAKELGDINTIVTGYGLGAKTAFGLAADREKYRVMLHLMKNYPKLNVNTGAIDGKSPLELVEEQPSSENPSAGKLRAKVLRMMRERGAE